MPPTWRGWKPQVTSLAPTGWQLHAGCRVEQDSVILFMRRNCSATTPSLGPATPSLGPAKSGSPWNASGPRPGPARGAYFMLTEIATEVVELPATSIATAVSLCVAFVFTPARRGMMRSPSRWSCRRCRRGTSSRSCRCGGSSAARRGRRCSARRCWGPAWRACRGPGRRSRR